MHHAMAYSGRPVLTCKCSPMESLHQPAQFRLHAPYAPKLPANEGKEFEEYLATPPSLFRGRFINQDTRLWPSPGNSEFILDVCLKENGSRAAQLLVGDTGSMPPWQICQLARFTGHWYMDRSHALLGGHP